MDRLDIGLIQIGVGSICAAVSRYAGAELRPFVWACLLAISTALIARGIVVIFTHFVQE